MNPVPHRRFVRRALSAEPADHVDHASARRHAREAAATEAWRDSEE